MDCFLDFCLACDKQTTEGLYCSQVCRLADLERAGSSAPSSPSSPAHESSFRSYFPSGPTGLHLPTQFNFNSKSHSHSNSCSHSSHSPTHSPRNSMSSEPATQRSLSPSSSRSSLSSSGQPTPLISEQARSELQGYVSAFDQTRELKRRSLSGPSGH